MSHLKTYLSVVLGVFTSISLNAQLCPHPIITAELSTGIWASEVSWGVMNSEGNQVSGPFTGFENNTLYIDQLCLEPGCYTIWMEDSYGDGWQGAILTVEDMEGNVLATGSVPVTPGDEWTTPLPIGVECPYPECTFEEAFNFNTLVNIDDGSCERQSDNVNLFANWNDSSLPNNSFGGPFSDVEGLKVADREYAIIGSTLGAHIIDVSSTDLVEVQFLAGAAGGSFITHRDYHIDGNLLFAVSDQGSSSLQIFDLSNLPESVDIIYDDDEFCINAHNVFVDNDSDLLYLCNTDNPDFSTDLLVLDVSEPSNPSILVDMSPWISNCHDIYVENNIAWINSRSQGYYVMHID